MYYLFLVIFSSLSCIAFASTPQGFKLISGEAKAPVVDSQGVVTISSGKNAIVHWDTFSIGKGACVRFAQADTTSAILNRVVGFSESRINGSLLSNGKVFLINKNGVVIGPHGRIETAGFVASTLDLTNEDFLKGKELLFKGDSTKKVVNLGTIVAKEGDAVLIGQNVDNQGSIQAPHGHALIGCGREILLQPEGKEHIFIRLPVSTSEEEQPPAVLEHSGTIAALVAELKCGATPFVKAIKSSGKINALAVHEEGGKVFLVAENGRADISGQIVAKQGEHGGNVQLLGKEVYLLDKAEIEACGDKGGGNILVGGDFKGNNPDVLNADISYVGQNVVLRASAHTQGDGGKVIIWGEQATGYFGLTEAKGGAISGNGGVVEVSCPHGEKYRVRGLVNTSAPNGLSGELYLDPFDITISNAADSCASCPNCFTPSGTYTPCCASNENLSITTLTNQLALTNVTILTSSTCSTGTGTITVTDNIFWNSNNNLTLNAVGDLVINGLIINSGNGNIYLSSGGDCTVTSFVDPENGIVNASIGGNCSIVSSGGFRSNGATNWQINGSLTMNTGGISVSGGDLNLNVGNNLSMTQSSIGNDTGSLLLFIGNSATLTNSNISTMVPDSSGGGNILIVVDNAHPSSIGSGGLTIDSTSTIMANSGMATRIFGATQGNNNISPLAILGNGSAPTTFTPGTPFVNTITEMWGIFYSTSTASLGGNPYTFFYKQSATPSSSIDTSVRVAAIYSVAVTNTTLTNLFSTSPSYAILTNSPNGAGQAIPLTQNENIKAHNDSMSEMHCP